MEEVVRRIEARQAVVGVVGLGYVGLSVATLLAAAGFHVAGVDVDARRVGRISSGDCPIRGREPELPELLARVTASRHLVAHADYSALAQADVILIAVDTPVSSDHRPRFATLRAACASLGAVMKPGALVVVESTVAPGTCDGVVARALAEASGRALNEGFFLGHCPERVMPGRLLENLRALPRVCGASSPAASSAMVALYSTIVRAGLERCDCVTAELVKTAENAYRDVNVAFANELGMICETVGADFRRVRELVNQSPGRNVLMAGAGVGGHCIPKDPWLLSSAVDGAWGGGPRLLRAAREVNDAMPEHVARLVEDALAEARIPLEGATIALYGYAYLADSDDTRNSPTQALIDRLLNLGAKVAVHDPWVGEYAGDLYAVAQGAACAVLMVAHSVYRDFDLARLRRTLASPVLVDGRFLVEARAARDAGFVFRGLGRGERAR
jgi:UDP-N-acetyl-D-mannosaminuronic acid dehydrogenase